MTFRLKHLAALAIAASAMAATARADLITVRRGLTSPQYPSGYQGVADNTIFYYAAPTADSRFPAVWMRSSDGGSTTIRAATSSSNTRSLLRFDLSGLAGMTVTSDATLTLTSSGAVSAATYGLYQIAPGNAGWTESTRTGFAPSTATSTGVYALDGNPTWWYKSIDTDAPNTSFTTSAADTTSTKWLSGQVSLGNQGSNAEGYANTGGLWNPIDLVDQNPATVASNYLTMGNMDPVASATVSAVGAYTFIIPAAIIQSWIDNPSANAGLLGRWSAGTTLSFISSENGTAASRPTLSFTAVPEAGAVAFGLLATSASGIVLVVRRRRKNA